MATPALSPPWHLVPQVVDAVDGKVPVVAAGGIFDGRGLDCIALALGAEGVWIGTKFIATHEAHTGKGIQRKDLESPRRRRSHQQGHTPARPVALFVQSGATIGKEPIRTSGLSWASYFSRSSRHSTTWFRTRCTSLDTNKCIHGCIGQAVVPFMRFFLRASGC